MYEFDPYEISAILGLKSRLQVSSLKFKWLGFNLVYDMTIQVETGFGSRYERILFDFGPSYPYKFIRYYMPNGKLIKEVPINVE